MVVDGIRGGFESDGLAYIAIDLIPDWAKGLIDDGANGLSDRHAKLWYQVARIYNSGSLIDPNDLLAADNGTDRYVTDVANRLMGNIV